MSLPNTTVRSTTSSASPASACYPPSKVPSTP
jgi:hypothetical protein